MSVNPTPQVTMVRAPACHFCHEAEETLEALAQAGAITLTILEADSQQGRDLIVLHRPAMAPLVLLDGWYFSAGRLPKTKLARILGAARLTVART